MKRSVEITIRTVVIVTVALLVLAAISWGVSYLHLPPWAGVGVAMGIAALKVMLVMLYYMELAEQRGGLRIVALTAPAFVMILIFLALADVWTR